MRRKILITLVAVSGIYPIAFAIEEGEACKNWHLNPKSFNNCSTHETCSQWTWRDQSGNLLDHGDETCESVRPGWPLPYYCNDDFPATISAIREEAVCEYNGASCSRDWIPVSNSVVSVSRKIGRACPSAPILVLNIDRQVANL